MTGSGRRTGRIDLVGVHRRFGDVTALDEVSLTINAGEYFCLHGPSGSGKTAALRLLTGADQPSSGQVLVDGEDASGSSTYRHTVSAIFGGYTLFPFLDVAANVAFGLRHAGARAARGRAETSIRVRSALAAVQMSEYARRRPPQLSGEQQQRVALARALVVRPRILVLDDPLRSVDGRLRSALREDLRTVQRQVGITVVHSTADRDEALALADRVAVLSEGRILQVGTAREILALKEPTAA